MSQSIPSHPLNGSRGTRNPAAAAPLRITTLDGWHLYAILVPRGGIIVTLERVLGPRGSFPVSFQRRISQGQAEALRDWLVKVLG